jgi:ribosomal protein L32
MSHLNELKKWVFQAVTEEVQAERLSICETCPEYKASIHLCNVCKCLVGLKTGLARQSCPLGKWMDVK